MNRKTLLGFLLVAVIVFALGSCLSNKGLDDSHSSRDSLDWEGVYAGTIPAASGPGIDVRLRLNADQSFILWYEYLDRPNNQFNWTGSFTWDNKGNIITLDVKDAPPYYQVAENKLIQLDMKGKPITGNLADNYVLKKEG